MDQEREPANTSKGDGSGAPNLGADGTIPNTDTGIAVGHDPDGSNFNPEEDADSGD